MNLFVSVMPKYEAPGRTDLEQKLSLTLRWRTKVRREGVNGNRIKNFNLFEENLGFSTLISFDFDKSKSGDAESITSPPVFYSFMPKYEAP